MPVQMEVGERRGLRADVAAAERIVFVTTDVQALVAIHCDLDPTDRLAEIAATIMDRIIHGASPSRALTVVRRSRSLTFPVSTMP